MDYKMKAKYYPIQERILSFLTVEGRTLQELYFYFEGKIHFNIIKHALQTLLLRKIIRKKLNKDGKTEVFFI